MNVGITGATGFIGQALAVACKKRGHRVVGFSRELHPTQPPIDEWRIFDLEKPVPLDGLDGLVHLAGEPVIGWWTREKRRKIIASRRDSTRALVAAMNRMELPIKVFLCASGTGFYGNRGAEILDETARHGIGFLSEVAQVWEEEARAEKVRSCQLRTGMVLGKNGGAWPLLRKIFSLGLGGRLGGGHQFLPWIHLDDVVGLYLHALENDGMHGAINAVAPQETTNAEFTHALGRVLGRPTIFPVPEFLLRAVLGDMASVVLDSQRAVPRRALETGFSFEFQTIHAAMANLAKP